MNDLYNPYIKFYGGIKTFKPIIYDLFKDGNYSWDNPGEITSKHQLEEEFKRREESGIIPLTD